MPRGSHPSPVSLKDSIWACSQACTMPGTTAAVAAAVDTAAAAAATALAAAVLGLPTSHPFSGLHVSRGNPSPTHYPGQSPSRFAGRIRLAFPALAQRVPGHTPWGAGFLPRPPLHSSHAASWMPAPRPWALRQSPPSTKDCISTCRAGYHLLRHYRRHRFTQRRHRHRRWWGPGVPHSPLPLGLC